MKILQVNKFYYPKGGADKYFLDLSSALEKAGHQVAVFSMKHENNLASPFSSYFVSNIDFNNLKWWQAIKVPGRIIYSQEAKRKFKKLVKSFRPDIIHIHNIYHQISPSILDVACKFKIPVVMHLHDYKLICPNYQLFANGHPCEACYPDKYYQCLRKKCFKNSFRQSFIAFLEMFIHHKILKIYRKNINIFIAPSQFMKEKVVKFGWEEKKIKIVINPYSSFIDKASFSEKEKDYLLYFGRLSAEKDIATLIKAAISLNYKLKITGHGPEEAKLKETAKQDKNSLIEFTGFKSGADLKNLILSAKAIVIPSICYDNMPLSLLDALHLGKIVIASKIGGIPEIIKDGINGLLFEPGNEESLKEKIRSLKEIDQESFSREAIKSVSNLSLENNMQAVIEIYQKCLEK